MATFRYVVDLAWTGSTGSPGVNVWHGRTTGGLDGSTETTGLTDLIKDFYAALAYIFPVTFTATGQEFVNGVGDDEGDADAVPVWTVTGSGSSSFAPPATAILVDWRTNSGGRQGRGRTFLGPIVAGLVGSNGGVESTELAALNTIVEDLVDGSDSFGNGALGVYSRTGSTFRDFTSGSIPSKLAVLRSRRD